MGLRAPGGGAARRARPGLVIYHCVDDIAAQPGIDAASFRAAEARFAARADLVLASAPALAERMRALSDNVLYVPNVADTDLFATGAPRAAGPLDPALAALPAPRIVFIGAVVSTKLDIDLLVALARPAAPLVVRAGRPRRARAIRAPTSRRSRAEPNVHLLGRRAYEQLPSVLRGADAGLIPYARNELTSSIFPMKVYEYLAAGLPVVSTPLPSLADDRRGRDAPPTPRASRSCSTRRSQKTAPSGAPSARASPQRHSWERRLEEIAAAIDAL